MNPLLGAVWTGRWLQEMESGTGPALLTAPFSRDLDHARMPRRALRSGRAGGARRASPRRRPVLSLIRRARPGPARQRPRVFEQPRAVDRFGAPGRGQKTAASGVCAAGQAPILGSKPARPDPISRRFDLPSSPLRHGLPGTQKKPSGYTLGREKSLPATSYSPTGSPRQYHRRWRA